VFSPGLGNPTLYYSSLLYELASRGFVIAALWHPYSTGLVVFPDGTTVQSNELGGISMNGASPDQAGAELERLGNVWASDQRFVVDQLTAWNATHPQLRGRLDLERIGAFGHSLGGASAAQAAHVDSRIDAGINIDGAMFGSVTKDPQGSRAPFMLIRGETPVPTDAELQQVGMTRAQAEAWLGTIQSAQAALIERTRGGRLEQLAHARHNTFMTDILFLPGIPQEVRAGLVGEVEAVPAFRQIGTWIADFMAAHIERNGAQ
jgi:pimeloyl-ACP methyl ester carboxylesterase